MVNKSERPIPLLEGSTLIHVEGSLFVDSVTGMVVSRVGWIHRSTGYEKIALNGVTPSVHRIVYEAVNGPIPEGLIVNHIDGVPSNNRPDNLEAIPQGENIRHAYRTGLRSGNGRKGKVMKRRLTPEQIERVRAAPRGTIKELAHELGIAQSYAYQIRHGRALNN